MNPHDPNAPHHSYFGAFPGYVINRDDPKRLGRIQARIPGFVDEGTAWARPLGLGGGIAAHGTKFVPPLGAEVVIFFLAGDIDSPVYMGLAAGIGEGKTGDDDHPDVRTIETDNYVISIDERLESKSLTLYDKESENLIQMNNIDRSIAIRATSQIDIQAEGFVKITGGLGVFINETECGNGKV